MTKIATAEVERLHNNVKQFLQSGKTENEIIELLKQEGLEEYYVQTIIDNVLADKRDRKDFWKLILMGTFTVVSGLFINYSSYSFAVQNGSGYFYLFWGIIVVGLLMIVRAFILFNKK
ncbi:MAG: hypothetical protein IPP48_12975 [Chitinophagaceae bacterium]|nr:hypothetical protein [Chitinophagaceae bacterium]